MVSLVEGPTDLHKRHKLMAFTIPFPTAFWKSNLLSVDLDKNSPLEQTLGSSACFHYTFPNTFPLSDSWPWRDFFFSPWCDFTKDNLEPHWLPGETRSPQTGGETPSKTSLPANAYAPSSSFCHLPPSLLFPGFLWYDPSIALSPLSVCPPCQTFPFPLQPSTCYSRLN